VKLVEVLKRVGVNQESVQIVVEVLLSRKKSQRKARDLLKKRVRLLIPEYN
jgi:ribosomal protein S28E/S33